jgi:hypothetical protein
MNDMSIRSAANSHTIFTWMDGCEHRHRVLHADYARRTNLRVVGRFLDARPIG